MVELRVSEKAAAQRTSRLVTRQTLQSARWRNCIGTQSAWQEAWLVRLCTIAAFDAEGVRHMGTPSPTQERTMISSGATRSEAKQSENISRAHCTSDRLARRRMSVDGTASAFAKAVRALSWYFILRLLVATTLLICQVERPPLPLAVVEVFGVPRRLEERKIKYAPESPIGLGKDSWRNHDASVACFS
ncbi:hypothetical protein EJ03DRAFT_20959 [Teratosphaeria nubilosa]|uniref:Uncharacterized protein n=1 Tax=Teratosphaeria nubilosa TaxID=161662 RepID=A0A6G1LFI1_9PEZI|nr:hypothetical protein EJ03DRAFT_20959 [Teratosphaeria nubilosa]